MVEKLIGWRHYVDSFDWDIYIKSKRNIYLDRIILTTRKYHKVATSHYFFRFMYNVSFRYPKYISFKISKIKLKRMSYTHKSLKTIKKSLFAASYTFRFNNLTTLLFSYIIFFTYLPRGELLYTAHKKRGARGSSLVLKDFNSFNLLYLHDFPQDSAWAYFCNISIDFYYQGKPISELNRILSSQLKIFRHTKPVYQVI